MQPKGLPRTVVNVCKAVETFWLTCQTRDRRKNLRTLRPSETSSRQSFSNLSCRKPGSTAKAQTTFTRLTQARSFQLLQNNYFGRDGFAEIGRVVLPRSARLHQIFVRPPVQQLFDDDVFAEQTSIVGVSVIARIVHGWLNTNGGCRIDRTKWIC